MNLIIDALLLEEYVSDLHKDAYGFRPSSSFWNEWRSMDDADRQYMWDSMCETLKRVMEQERKEQLEAHKDFKNRVAICRAAGAQDNAMAIRWLDEAYGTNGDYGYLEYHLGIPYGSIAIFLEEDSADSA